MRTSGQTWQNNQQGDVSQATLAAKIPLQTLLNDNKSGRCRAEGGDPAQFILDNHNDKYQYLRRGKGCRNASARPLRPLRPPRQPR